MAINQAEIFTKLEKLFLVLNKNHYFYGFLEAFGFPAATISRLKSGERNIALDSASGEIAIKKGTYFKPVTTGEDIYKLVEELKIQPVIAKENIRFIFITNWIDVVAYDLKADEKLECSLESLHDNYSFFLPLAGYEKAKAYSENPADTKAAEEMGKLFDLIKEKNKPQKSEDIHALNIFLTRLLFCLFAEDTGIFGKNQMTSAIDSTTRLDGTDLIKFFEDLFEVLNEPDDSKLRSNKPNHFKNFPYVNGGLFKQKYPIPEFTNKARRILLDCGALQWQAINPDIFGSMFQSVINEDQRGNLGQHYTSVTNIMKVIQPLFLDKLNDELLQSRNSESKLKKLLERINQIKIFDPACGSGNFLIIAYKELRKIEIAIFKALDEVTTQKVIYMSGIKLTQFYGIEIDDFAHEIALLSLWLTEHQMNQAFKEEFGYSPPSLPLKESGHIACENSLFLDWKDFCPNDDEEEVYVCGNPPFLGHLHRDEKQANDMAHTLRELESPSKLDYVACWIWKGVQYIAHSNSEAAFVSTNSLCQGLQVGILWPSIFELGVKLKFAYQTFSWKNNAKDNAAVHVVILGFTSHKDTVCRLFSTINGVWHESNPKNINPYLISANNIVVKPTSKPLVNNILPMTNGSEYSNCEYLILNASEASELKGKSESKWLKRLLGAEEFLNGQERYCLWLVDASEDDINSSKFISNRVEKTRLLRLSKTNLGVKQSAKTPHLFKIINHPKGSYILVPRVTSERRPYVPVGFFNSETVATNANQIIPFGTLYEAGILMSTMHMEWMRTVGGRLKSDYRYSSQLIYNTFPWPTISKSQRDIIEKLTENIFLAREHYPEKTLAQLYDPDLMPIDLLEAHKILDQAVEKLYRTQPFKDLSDRLENLFKLYEKLVSNSNNKNIKTEGTEDLW